MKKLLFVAVAAFVLDLGFASPSYAGGGHSMSGGCGGGGGGVSRPFASGKRCKRKAMSGCSSRRCFR